MKLETINIFDLVMQDLMRKKGECLNFLQIGAHDGMHFDPVYPYVKKHHWRGVLVEPQPRIFRKLVQNYRDELQLKFENVAIAPASGPIKLNIFEDETLPQHSTMLASFLAEAVTNNTHGYKSPAKAIVVKGMPLAELLGKHKIISLDLLQIDAEGYDIEILKMLHKTALRPRAINFESAFYGREELQAGAEMLASMGYKLAATGIDTIAYLQDNDYARIQYKDQVEGI